MRTDRTGTTLKLMQQIRQGKAAICLILWIFDDYGGTLLNTGLKTDQLQLAKSVD
jgi:hypothetical protein